jgi:formylglycine-generating enzyme required for sulfatase activity
MNKDNNIDNYQMIDIPVGEIVLNDDRIKHKWKVGVQSFLLSPFLVTQDLYYSVTKESPFSFKGSQRPAENVSWYDAIHFCNQFSKKTGLTEYYSVSRDRKEVNINLSSNGYRLPTEAEWEYACRAGTTEARYGEIDKIAWYKENSNDTTHEVGEKQPNAWGLYDMLGNVWEWNWDIYDEVVYGSYRIFRGGGWNDSARGCLATNRRRSHPTFKIDDLGFRVARSY